MLDTMQCLQNALVPEATQADSGAGVTCESIKNKAFRTHAECYVGIGLAAIIHPIGLLSCIP
jgi:hypothetical protein